MGVVTGLIVDLVADVDRGESCFAQIIFGGSFPDFTLTSVDWKTVGPETLKP